MKKYPIGFNTRINKEPEESVPMEVCKDYYNEVIAYAEEQEQLEEELDYKITAYINKLSKGQLQDLVYDLLYNGPEWQFDKFVNENIEW